MDDTAMQTAVTRAQDTANQAYELAAQGKAEIQLIKDRVSDVVSRLTFQEKVILNHADALKSNTEAVTAIQISNAGISNEVKNMTLTSNRIEASIASFMTDVKKGFADVRVEVDDLSTTKATALGSYKTWAIVGGVFLILIQVVLPLVMARFTAIAPMMGH